MLAENQRMVVKVGAALLAVAFLFPPWLKRSLMPSGRGNDTYFEEAGEYAPVFAPPSSARLDLPRLLVEVVGIVTVGGLLFILSMDRHPDSVASNERATTDDEHAGGMN
jgi:hypothetical protein